MSRSHTHIINRLILCSLDAFSCHVFVSLCVAQVTSRYDMRQSRQFSPSTENVESRVTTARISSQKSSMGVGIQSGALRFYSMKGAKHEQVDNMVDSSADGGTAVHSPPAPDGGRRVLLGRHFEIRLHQPGCGPVHQAGDSVSSFHRNIHWRARDRRGDVVPGGISHPAHFGSVHHRDDRGHTQHQDLAFSRDFAAAIAAGAAKDGDLGGPARDTCRLCTDRHLCISLDQRSGQVVAGCAAAEAAAEYPSCAASGAHAVRGPPTRWM